MTKASKHLVTCIDNAGYEVSLERRRIHVELPDARAEKLDQIRVIDESGEDYLHPQEYVVAVALPSSIRGAVLQAA